MRSVPPEIYDRIDNRLYDAAGESWWQPESSFYQLKVSFNPVRVGYARRKLLDELHLNSGGKQALDVGCGGGLVCEEIARLGFDVVFCFDVLEHVRDLPQVIREIARVLKPGGVFCYDTINRTWLSYLVAIKIGQDWRRWAFMPPNLHVWEMFIKPREMTSLLRENGLEWKEHRGIKPGVSVPTALRYLRRRARGEWSYADLGEKVRLVESRITAVMYLGCAVKP